MRQLLQNLGSGELVFQDVPVPQPTGRRLVVETRTTLISAGTERMLVDFARASLLRKAAQQPDRVRQVLQKVATDGLGPTLDAVRSRLDDPLPLGYCQAGHVRAVGSGVDGFSVGDRVVTNGPHAEWVSVPHTLAARIPDGVTDEAACFTPLAAIGLQGIRLAEPTIGETVVVFGLGLIGLLTVQILRASGCEVIGIDRDAARLDLARRFGADAVNGTDADVVRAVLDRTRSRGADAVLLTLASADDTPVRQAAAMARQRGRLVLVGVSGLQLAREDFYRKELTFQVSCSYGPGRYDPRYEDDGVDYPLAFARWTAQRNFDAVLSLMRDGRIDPLPLVTHRFAFSDAKRAYDLVTGGEPSLGVILDFPVDAAAATARPIADRPAAVTHGGNPGVGVIGAGNFARRTLLPLLKAAGVDLRVISSAQGVTAAMAAAKFGVGRAASSTEAVLADPAVDTLFVLTRHASHGRLVLAGLEAGKHVFVEKPLALREDELDAIEAAVVGSDRLLTVGFNRRFAPMAEELKQAIGSRSGPASVMCVVNAGALPPDHWTRSPEHGGGRIVGEACHFIDLTRFLIGAPIADLTAAAARDRTGRPVDDVAHITVRFVDGSIATITYLSTGSRAYPKEQLTVHVDGRTFHLDNWRRLRRFGSGSTSVWPKRQDKGHRAEIEAWVKSLRSGGPPPIPYPELFEVSRWAIRAEAQVRGVVAARLE